VDDLSAKLGELLNDPETVSKIGEMAKNLFPEQESQNEGNSPDMLKIMSLINRFKNTGENENQRLLMALKPHLSNERQKKVDTAVKILKLLELMPVLSESGLLENFL
jgi:hypothetical protein